MFPQVKPKIMASRGPELRGTQAYQRQGYAQEAAQRMVDWLRQNGVGDVVAHIHPDHHASSAVARPADDSLTSEEPHPFLIHRTRPFGGQRYRTPSRRPPGTTGQLT